MFQSLLRLVGGLTSIVLGALASVAAIVLPGGPARGGLLVAFACLVLGGVGAQVARTVAAPWRPLRLCLGWASVVTAFLLSSLPFPPSAGERANALIWAALLLGGLTAAVGVSRWPRVTAVLLGLGALWGGFLAARFLTLLAPQAGRLQGPAIVLSYVLAGSVGAMWLAALWHGRRLRFAAAPPAPLLGAA